jgi:TATA-binding protein-associated factor Taf7
MSSVDTKVVMRIVEAIEELVADDRTMWKDKKAAILQVVAKQDAEIAFEEFISWFDDLTESALEEEEG